MIKVIILLLACCHVRSQQSGGIEETISDTNAADQHYKLTNATVKAKQAVSVFKMLPELVKMDNPTLDSTKKQISDISNHLLQIGNAVSLVKYYMSTKEDKKLEFIAQSFIGDDAQFLSIDSTSNEVYEKMRNSDIFERLNLLADGLNQMSIKFGKFMNDTSKHDYWKDFVEMCDNRDRNPSYSMKIIRALFNSKNTKTSAIEKLLEFSDYDFNALKQFFAVILHDFTKAACLHQACLGVLKSENENLQQEDAISSEAEMESIVFVFKESVDQLIKTGLEQRLDKDMKKMLKVGYKPSNIEICWNLTMFLNTKYFWLDWNVIVFDRVTKEHFINRTEKCWSRFDSNAGFNVVVTWSTKEDYEMKRDLLFQIYTYLEYEKCMGKCLGKVHTYDRPHSLSGEFSKLNYASSYLILHESVNLYFSLSDNAKYYRDCRSQIVFTVE